MQPYTASFDDDYEDIISSLSIDDDARVPAETYAAVPDISSTSLASSVEVPYLAGHILAPSWGNVYEHLCNESLMRDYLVSSELEDVVGAKGEDVTCSGLTVDNLIDVFITNIASGNVGEAHLLLVLAAMESDQADYRYVGHSAMCWTALYQSFKYYVHSDDACGPNPHLAFIAKMPAHSMRLRFLHAIARADLRFRMFWMINRGDLVIEMPTGPNGIGGEIEQYDHLSVYPWFTSAVYQLITAGFGSFYEVAVSALEGKPASGESFVLRPYSLPLNMETPNKLELVLSLPITAGSHTITGCSESVPVKTNGRKGGEEEKVDDDDDESKLEIPRCPACSLVQSDADWIDVTDCASATYIAVKSMVETLWASGYTTRAAMLIVFIADYDDENNTIACMRLLTDVALRLLTIHKDTHTKAAAAHKCDDRDCSFGMSPARCAIKHAFEHIVVGASQRSFSSSIFLHLFQMMQTLKMTSAATISFFTLAASRSDFVTGLLVAGEMQLLYPTREDTQFILPLHVGIEAIHEKDGTQWPVLTIVGVSRERVHILYLPPATIGNVILKPAGRTHAHSKGGSIIVTDQVDECGCGQGTSHWHIKRCGVMNIRDGKAALMLPVYDQHGLQSLLRHACIANNTEIAMRNRKPGPIGNKEITQLVSHKKFDIKNCRAVIDIMSADPFRVVVPDNKNLRCTVILPRFLVDQQKKKQQQQQQQQDDGMLSAPVHAGKFIHSRRPQRVDDDEDNGGGGGIAPPALPIVADGGEEQKEPVAFVREFYTCDACDESVSARTRVQYSCLHKNCKAVALHKKCTRYYRKSCLQCGHPMVPFTDKKKSLSVDREDGEDDDDDNNNAAVAGVMKWQQKADTPTKEDVTAVVTRTMYIPTVVPIDRILGDIAPRQREDDRKPVRMSRVDEGAPVIGQFRTNQKYVAAAAAAATSSSMVPSAPVEEDVIGVKAGRKRTKPRLVDIEFGRVDVPVQSQLASSSGNNKNKNKGKGKGKGRDDDSSQ
jgi:hypothetical protein